MITLPSSEIVSPEASKRHRRIGSVEGVKSFEHMMRDCRGQVRGHDVLIQAGRFAHSGIAQHAVRPCGAGQSANIAKPRHQRTSTRFVRFMVVSSHTMRITPSDRRSYFVSNLHFEVIAKVNLYLK